MSEELQTPPSPSELILQRLQKLKILLDGGISYRLESVFAKTTGWWANSEIKRRAKLIRMVEPKLKEMLLPNEDVLYVAKGVQYSLAESYFMGALLAAMLNQTVFVLTNLRLLMMRSKSNGKPMETFWVIYYSEIEQFRPTWTGILKLRLRDRKSMTFNGFSRLDRQAMPKIFQDAIDQYRRVGFEPEVSQSRENLCSYCFKVVPKSEYVCDHCGSNYWTPNQLAVRSLIFPSWGDLCMKHYGVASIEMFFYGLSWIAAAVALSDRNTEKGLYLALAIFIIEHPVDAIMTYFVARKGLNPRLGPNPERVRATSEDGDLPDDDEVEEDES